MRLDTPPCAQGLGVLVVEEEGVGPNALERREVAGELGFEVHGPNVPVLITSGVLSCKQKMSEIAGGLQQNDKLCEGIKKYYEHDTRKKVWLIQIVYKELLPACKGYENCSWPIRTSLFRDGYHC